MSTTRITFKITHKDENRLFRGPSTLSYVELESRLREMFSTQAALRIRYKDADGDLITIADDGSLHDAVELAVASSADENAVVRLQLSIPDAAPSATFSSSSSDDDEDVAAPASAPPAAAAPGNALPQLLQQFLGAAGGQGQGNGGVNIAQLLSNPLVQMLITQFMSVYQQNVAANGGQVDIASLLASPMAQSFLSMLQGMGQQQQQQQQQQQHQRHSSHSSSSSSFAASSASQGPVQVDHDEDRMELERMLEDAEWEAGMRDGAVEEAETETFLNQVRDMELEEVTSEERQSLEQLEAMGFLDRKRNLEALRRHNGFLVHVIDELAGAE